jgi:hypothetical protein
VKLRSLGLIGNCQYSALVSVGGPLVPLMAHSPLASSTAAYLDALFGRVTYEMMEAAWRPPARTGARPDWMEPFARTIDAAKKYVVSSTLDRVDWNAKLGAGIWGRPFSSLSRSRVRDCSWEA